MRLARLRHLDRQGAAPDRGQSLVEFALVLVPLFLILLGIIQFGFIFNSYVTITNAAREGARTGTVFACNATTMGASTWTKAQCDLKRNDAVKASFIASMNLLVKTAPNFATTTTWTQTGTTSPVTFTNGDLVVAYVLPSGVLDADSRVGQQLTIRATYHQDLIIPLIAQLLPRDTNGRLGMGSEVTMVVN